MNKPIKYFLWIFLGVPLLLVLYFSAFDFDSALDELCAIAEDPVQGPEAREPASDDDLEVKELAQ